MNKPHVISHWYMLMEDFETSGLDFYRAVEDALRERGVPDARVSRVEWKEGGLATAKREYLRIERSRVAFDICAAPFGTGYFFSWWLARIPQPYGAVVLGAVLFRKATSYPLRWGTGREVARAGKYTRNSKRTTDQMLLRYRHWRG